MSGNQDIDITNLFEKIENTLFKLNITRKIEYLRYKESIYIPESIQTDHEKAFFHFPYDEVNAFDKIQIFHEFYTTDVWGFYRPLKIGDEKYNFCLHEIDNRIKESKSKYIYQKLREKYANIADNIPAALDGYKRSEKLPDNHPEKNVLISLLKKYKKLLSRSDIHLGIFNNLYLNTYISDIFTEILIDLIQLRLQLLDPEIKKYEGQPEPKVKFEEKGVEEIIPIIKLNYASDQQKLIIKFMFNKLFPDYIDDSYEQFESHFIESDNEFRQTVWNGSEREIAHLFKSLKDFKIVLSQDQNKLIEIHFRKKDGKSFKNQQLRVAHSQSSIDTFTAIDQLIKDVKKLSAKF